MMPAQPPKCKLCGVEHWNSEGHKLPKEARSEEPTRTSVPQAPQVQPAIVTKPVTPVTMGVTSECVCPLCGAGHRPGGPMSAAERKRASRMRARAREGVGDAVD